MDGTPQQMRRLAVLFSLLGWGDEGPSRAGFLCEPPFEAILAPGPVTLLEAALTLPLAPFRIADDRALQLTMPLHDDAIPALFDACKSQTWRIGQSTHPRRGWRPVRMRPKEPSGGAAPHQLPRVCGKISLTSSWMRSVVTLDRVSASATPYAAPIG